MTGVAEASIPGSWTHLLARHWLALLYLFELVALIGGLALTGFAFAGRNARS
jgi:hypothetical protein